MHSFAFVSILPERSATRVCIILFIILWIAGTTLVYIIVAMVATIELCGMHKEMSTFRSCVCILEYRSRKTHVLLF